jgi:hypothetical protein
MGSCRVATLRSLFRNLVRNRHTGSREFYDLEPPTAN